MMISRIPTVECFSIRNECRKGEKKSESNQKKKYGGLGTCEDYVKAKSLEPNENGVGRLPRIFSFTYIQVYIT